MQFWFFPFFLNLRFNFHCHAMQFSFSVYSIFKKYRHLIPLSVCVGKIGIKPKCLFRYASVVSRTTQYTIFPTTQQQEKKTFAICVCCVVRQCRVVIHTNMLMFLMIFLFLNFINVSTVFINPLI